MRTHKSVLRMLKENIFGNSDSQESSSAPNGGVDDPHPTPGAQPLALSMLPDSLQVTKHNGILTLALNRPSVLNALNLELAEALRLLLQLATKDSTVRAIIITGRGRAFCSGGDLKFAMEANPEFPGDSFQALTTILNECVESIRTMAKPVIAAINGPAAGAGLFLALACDLRLMARTAYLKQSNTSYGLSLPAGGTFFLPRLIGLGRALEMVLLDQPIDAPKAKRMGLVAEVVEDDLLYTQAETLATQLVEKPINTLGLVKRLMNESFERSLSEQLLAEQQAIVQSANHSEGRAGLSAFVRKRKPVYYKR